MHKVVVVYHSGYGHTARLAIAIRDGAAAVADIDAKLLAIDAEGNLSDEDWQLLDQAEAIVFGSPTYMGGPSWQIKKFAETSSRRWAAQTWKDKLAAGFTNSATINGDKYVTVQYFMTLAMQHSMLWIGTGLLPANKKSSQRNDVNYLGGFTGVFGQSPADSTPDEGPLPGDLETGRQFGVRIAEAAKRW